MLPFLFAHLKTAHHSQSARVVKGVDLRSTAGNCAWVQTPWLTLSHVQASCLTPSTSQVHGYLTMFSSPPWPNGQGVGPLIKIVGSSPAGDVCSPHTSLLQQFSDCGLLNMLPSAAEWRSG